MCNYQWQFFTQCTCENQINLTLKNNYRSLETRDSQECSWVSTTCIIGGKTTPWICMANFKIKTWRKVHHLGINCESKSLYLELWGGGGFLKRNNNINVLYWSPIIYNLLSGISKEFNFVVNRTTYLHYYFLTNGIHPLGSCTI